MSLDLGAVIGRVVLETVEFDRAYTRTLGKLRTFGAEAQRGSNGVRVLDRSTLGAAASADKASTSFTRASQSAARQAAAEEKAAAAARVHSEATAQVTALMGRYAGESTRVQQSALRLAASEARVAEVQAKGTATTRQLASAQAGLIGSQRALSKAQEEGAVASSRMAGGLRSGIKMAAELGLLIGAIEIGKKAIEFVGAGKELTTALNGVQAASHATDAQMKAVRAQSIALGHDLTVPRATAVDAADAINDLVRAGVSLERAMVAARPALLLASAAQVSTADSARILGDVLDEFMLPATQAKAVADALAAGATSAGGGLLDMFDAMKYIGPRARAVGLGVNDIVTAIAELAKAGIQGSIAGTGLAMMLQKIAAPSDKSRKALADLGVTAWDAQGRFVGLPSLIDQLSAAQKRFGPNAKRFLGDISTAFGARAANVVAAFAGKGVKSYNEFAERVASGDVQKYADKMNRGLGAAMGQIHKQFVAAGIDVYQKLEPALATAAMWLGTTVPHAVGVLVNILGPTVGLVGSVLVAAWHGLSVVLGIAASALGAIGHVAEQNSTLIRDLITPVLALWLAFKGYAVGVAAFKVIQGAIVMTRVRMLELRATAGTLGATMVAGLGPVAFAITAIGLALGAAILHSNDHSAALQRERTEMDALTTAIKDDSGALANHSREVVKTALESAGAFKAARELHISLADLTDAAMGNAAAMHRVTGAYDLTAQMQRLVGRLSDDDIKRLSKSTSATDRRVASVAILNRSLGESNKAVHGAVQASKDSAAADKHATTTAEQRAAATKKAAASLMWVVDASGRLVQVESKTKGAADIATNALKAQTTASTMLKQAMDLLNGVNQTLEVSTDQFSISLGNLRNKTALATDANGKQSASLKQSTVAGATNRQMLVGMIDAAKAQAQATADQAAKHGTLESALRKGNTQLAKNEDAIRAAAKAAGMDKGEVDKLIASMGILSTVHPKPVVTVVDHASGPLRTIKAHLDSIHGKTVTITALTLYKDGTFSTKGNAGTTLHGGATGGTAGVIARGFAAGGRAGDGPSGTVVGPGTGTSDSVFIRVSKDEEIIRASQARKHRRLLKAINAGVSGFAMGGSVRSASGSMTGPYGRAGFTDGRRSVRIDKLEVNQFYPEPDTGRIALPHAMEAAAHALDGY